MSKTAANNNVDVKSEGNLRLVSFSTEVNGFEAIIERFLTHLSAVEGRAENTIRTYRKHLREMASYLKDRNITDIVQVSYAMVVEYLAFLDKFIQPSGSEYAPNTKAIKKNTLKSFFHYCFEEKHIDEDFSRKIKVPRSSKRNLKKRQSLTPEEVKTMMETIIKNEKDIYRERNALLIAILAYTGVRVKELSLTTVGHIDLNTRKYYVPPIKGAKEPRVVPLNDQLLDILKKFITSRNLGLNDYLLRSRQNPTLSAKRIQSIIKEYAILSGMKKHVTPHTFRTTFATLLDENSVSIVTIRDLMGHADIETTRKYIDVKKKQKVEAINLLDFAV